ncbi:MAG TPA: hypothetical protein PLA27_08460 [Anaerolineales bacterium]|nr:hypothetical protein [Anaerolineales bacterium]HQX16441.1 hypothetical protein [Anaerolineales bacterium]
MKKLFLGCLLLITACKSATATPAPETSLFPTSTHLPTLLPASPTPEPAATPTFEPSPTALPRYFVQDFNDSIAGWVILQAGNNSVPAVNVANGSLLLQIDSPFTWLYALYGPEDYADARIEAQYQNRAGTPASAGLVCRYSETDGWLEFNLSTDGLYNILYGKWLALGVAEYAPIADGAIKNAQPSGASQTIGLECSGDTLTLLVNETVLRRMDVSRFELGTGKVGVTVASYENFPVVVGFERVEVSEP